MKKMLWALFASSLASFPASAQTPVPPAATVTVDYDKDVKPLFAQHCYSCHGPQAQQSGLRLDLRQNALRGGDYGPVIVAGKSAESKLIRRLVDGDGGMQMPPSGPLTAEEIGLLRAWIDQGAEFRTTVEDEAPERPLDPALGALIAAVRSGPRSAVERLLAENRARLNETDPNGSTLLHHAAAFGSLETMRVLLEAGAEVNAANRRRSTPLHWAIADEAKVRLLLGRGADVNARVVEGRTPLSLAAQLGNPYGVMRALLEQRCRSQYRVGSRADAADDLRDARRSRGHQAAARCQGQHQREERRRRDCADGGRDRRQPARRAPHARARRGPQGPVEAQ